MKKYSEENTNLTKPNDIIDNINHSQHLENGCSKYFNSISDVNALDKEYQPSTVKGSTSSSEPITHQNEMAFASCNNKRESESKASLNSTDFTDNFAHFSKTINCKNETLVLDELMSEEHVPSASGEYILVNVININIYLRLYIDN